MSILAILLALSFSPFGGWTLAGNYPKELEFMEEFELVMQGICKPKPTQEFRCDKVRDKIRNEDFLVVFDAQGEIIVVYKLDGENMLRIYPPVGEGIPNGI